MNDLTDYPEPLQVLALQLVHALWLGSYCVECGARPGVSCKPNGTEDDALEDGYVLHDLRIDLSNIPLGTETTVLERYLSEHGWRSA